MTTKAERHNMQDIQLVQGETINFRSNRPVELVDSSEPQKRLHKKMGKHWVIVTNMRLIFYPAAGNKTRVKDKNVGCFSEKLENVDYFAYIEQGKILPKNYIRVWINLTRFDLLGDRTNLQEILNQFKTSIQLKLKKGAVILYSLGGKETGLYRYLMTIAKEQNIDLVDLLSKGSISYTIPKEKAAVSSKGRKYMENECNFNYIDCPDGSIKVILIPSLPITRKTIIADKS
jgi:hypothetical protein